VVERAHAIGRDQHEPLGRAVHVADLAAVERAEAGEASLTPTTS
jgi:hypothetical protein